MNLPSASSTQGAVSPEPQNEVRTRLYNHWLMLARVLWIALLFLAGSVFGASLPLYFALLHHVCTGADICYPGQLNVGSEQVLQNLGFSVGDYALFTLVLAVVLALVWFAVGVLIVWCKSDDWMALLVALMLVLAAGNGSDPGVLVQGNSPWPFLSVCSQFFLAVAFTLVCLLFPNGRFVPRWMPWVLLGLIPLFLLFAPWNPLQPPALLQVLPPLGIIGCFVFSQIYRYWHVSGPLQRQQTKWVVFALSVVLLGGFVEVLTLEWLPLIFPALSLPDPFHQFSYLFVWNLVPVLIPLSFAVAVLRYRLWDIDRIINRTLVYGALTLSIVALYILVVVGLGALFQAHVNLGISLLATGLVAVLFHPLRSRLQRAVNRLMYGERDDPYRVIARLGQRLEATLAPEVMLPTIVETVALALRLPYVAITLQEGDTSTPAASFGAPRQGEGLVRLPLIAQHEPVGELVLAPRAPGEAFTSPDQRLLEDLSRQIGVAVYAVRLTADLKRLTIDLQRSREQLVTAREEERRRLRRDLHDGLGPQLASLTLKLETARNRLAQDPLADALLSDLTTRTQSAVADIRRLVYALRPPALDELGLIPALREQALQYSDQVSVHLDAPECLPELPAAVEVAIYRIAQEALTNVVRHAAARHCDIQLTLDETAGWLSLSIQDDGCGLPPSRSTGVGLTSMRERAEELGGVCTIEQIPTGETLVLARLPYTRSETADVLVVTPTIVPQEEE